MRKECTYRSKWLYREWEIMDRKKEHPVWEEVPYRLSTMGQWRLLSSMMTKRSLHFKYKSGRNCGQVTPRIIFKVVFTLSNNENVPFCISMRKQKLSPNVTNTSKLSGSNVSWHNFNGCLRQCLRVRLHRASASTWKLVATEECLSFYVSFNIWKYQLRVFFFLFIYVPLYSVVISFRTQACNQTVVLKMDY